MGSEELGGGGRNFTSWRTSTQQLGEKPGPADQAWAQSACPPRITDGPDASLRIAVMLVRCLG